MPETTPQTPNQMPMMSQKHSHAAAWILGILVLVLLLALVAAGIYIVNDMQEESTVESMGIDVPLVDDDSAMMEEMDEDEEDIAGESGQTMAGGPGVYSDQYLLFEYPADIILNYNPVLEGRIRDDFVFLTEGDQDTWVPTGVTVSYPYKFSDDGIGPIGAEWTFDQFVAADRGTVSVENGEIDGQQYVKLTEFGLFGQYVTYWVELDDELGHVKISAITLNDASEDILSTVVSTLQFK